MNVKAVWASIAALCGLCAMPAMADGDIVYSARYYAPAGGQTYCHLYRINADGSHRVQVTFGSHDDVDPRWSPDGKSILFVRDKETVCVVDENGGPVQSVLLPVRNDLDYSVPSIRWWPDSKAIIAPALKAGEGAVVGLDGRILSRFKGCTWISASPDGDRAYVNGGEGGSVADLSSDHKLTIIRPLPTPVIAGTWVTPEAIVGVVEGEGDGEDGLSGFDENGSKLWARSISPVHSTNTDLGTPFRNVTAIPGDMRDVMLSEDVGNGTIRPDYNFWMASVDSGKATVLLSDRQFIVFRPGKQSYVTSPAEHLIYYGPSKKGRRRQVYVASLEVGAASIDTHPKAIVDGAVMVTSADWCGVTPQPVRH